MSNYEQKEYQPELSVLVLPWNAAKGKLSDYVQQLLRQAALVDPTFKQGRVHEPNIYGLVTTLGSLGFQKCGQFQLRVPQDGHLFSSSERATAVLPTRSFVNQMAGYLDKQYEVYRAKFGLPELAKSEVLTMWMLGQRSFDSYSVFDLNKQTRDDQGVLQYNLCSIKKVPLE